MAIDDDDDFFNRTNTSDLNSKIMLTAIVSLSFVVLLVTILHIYARCVLRRQARRQASLRRLGFIAASASVRALDPPRAGVDPAVIASLPKFLFKSAASAAAIECAICLSALDDGEIARSLPNCKHTFHADCVDRWLGSNSTCPVCRTEAEPRLVAEPREAAAAAPPAAPPAEDSAKIGGSSSRLSSFRRILSRERSSRRIHTQAASCGQEDGQQQQLPDLERQ